MQSYLQYRRIGLAVKRQIERDSEKALLKTTQSHIPHADPSPHDRSVSIETNEGFDDTGPGSNPAGGCHHHDGEEAHPMEVLRAAQTRYSERTALGYSMEGIHARDRMTHEGKGSKVFVVCWENATDPLNPQNKSLATRLSTTMTVACLAWIVGAAASIDVAVMPQASKEFGVSHVVESLATGMVSFLYSCSKRMLTGVILIGLFLVGFSLGAVFAGPLSETFGRNAVYISTLIVFMVFIMASGLSPNIGAQLVFRFLAGFFGSTPLTCAGGTIADMWNPLEKTYSFALYAIVGFGGPVLGPVVGSYIGTGSIGSWRWTEWIILIASGFVLSLICLFQIETYPPLLLKWKARHLRNLTGDDRFQAELEITKATLWTRLKIAMQRPFLMMGEPIIMLMALYLTIIYIVQFTFLDGYNYIFREPYGISQGLTNVIFAGIFVGIVFAGGLVPIVFLKTKREIAVHGLEDGKRINPEMRLWYAMLGGAPAIPISLFWMGWTDYSSVSIWSPICASVLFGYGLICIFMSAYMYIIDSYGTYSASALTFVTFTRYLTAGGMTVVGIPFYENVGTHWTLTIMACISLLMVPVPYVFYKWGHHVRARSRYALA